MTLRLLSALFTSILVLTGCDLAAVDDAESFSSIDVGFSPRAIEPRDTVQVNGNTVSGDLLFVAENYGIDNWRFQISAAHSAGIRDIVLQFQVAGDNVGSVSLCPATGCTFSSNSVSGWVSGINPRSLNFSFSSAATYTVQLLIQGSGEETPTVVDSGSFTYAPLGNFSDKITTTFIDGNLTLAWPAQPGVVQYRVVAKDPNGSQQWRDLNYRPTGDASLQFNNVSASTVALDIRAFNGSGEVGAASYSVVQRITINNELPVNVSNSSGIDACLFLPAQLYLSEVSGQGFTWDFDPSDSLTGKQVDAIYYNQGSSPVTVQTQGASSLNIFASNTGLSSPLSFVVTDPEKPNLSAVYGPYNIEILPDYSNAAISIVAQDVFRQSLLKVDKRDRALLMGDDPRTSSPNLTLIRLQGNGQVDATFGSNGRVDIDMGVSIPNGNTSQLVPVTAQQVGGDWLIGGRIEIIDATGQVARVDAFMVRINRLGALVENFVSGGKWHLPGVSNTGYEIGAITVRNNQAIFAALNKLSYSGSNISPSTDSRIFDVGVLITPSSLPSPSLIVFNLSAVRIHNLFDIQKDDQFGVLVTTINEIGVGRYVYQENSLSPDSGFTADVNGIRFGPFEPTNPNIVDSLITEDGTVWATGYLSPNASNKQPFYFHRNILDGTGTAGSGGAVSANSSGTVLPLALQQGLDESVNLIFAENAATSHGLIARTYPVQSGDNDLTLATNQAGLANTESFAASTLGNRVLYSHLTNSTRNVAQFLPVRMDDNFLFDAQGLSCSQVELYDIPEPANNLASTVSSVTLPDSGDTLVLLEEVFYGEYTYRLIERLSGGDDWDLYQSFFFGESQLDQWGIIEVHEILLDALNERLIASVEVDTSSVDYFNQFGEGSEFTDYGVIAVPIDGTPPSWLFDTNGPAYDLWMDSVGNVISIADTFSFPEINSGALPAPIEDDNSSLVQATLLDSNDGIVIAYDTEFIGGNYIISLRRYPPVNAVSAPWTVTIESPTYREVRALTNVGNGYFVLVTADENGGALELLKYATSGTPDLTFGSAGKLGVGSQFTFASNPPFNTENTTVIADGSFIYLPVATGTGLAVLRLNMTNGAIDATWGNGGQVALETSAETISHVSLVNNSLRVYWSNSQYNAVTAYSTSNNGAVETAYGVSGTMRFGIFPAETPVQLLTNSNGQLFPMVDVDIDNGEISDGYSAVWGLNSSGARLQNFGNQSLQSNRDLGSVRIPFEEGFKLFHDGNNRLLALGKDNSPYNDISAYRYDIGIGGESAGTNPSSLLLGNEIFGGPPPQGEFPIIGGYEGGAGVASFGQSNKISNLLDGRSLIADQAINVESYQPYIAALDKTGRPTQLPFASGDSLFLTIDNVMDVAAVQEDGNGNVFLLLMMVEMSEIETSSPYWALYRISDAESANFVTARGPISGTSFIPNEFVFADEGHVYISSQSISSDGNVLSFVVKENAFGGSLASPWGTNGLWNLSGEAFEITSRLIALADGGLLVSGMTINNHPAIVRIGANGNERQRWQGSMLAYGEGAHVFDMSLDPRGHLNVLMAVFRNGQWKTQITRLPGIYRGIAGVTAPPAN